MTAPFTPFPGWRAVGQAMRWARHHNRIRGDRTTLEAPSILGSSRNRVEHRWFMVVPTPGRPLLPRTVAEVSFEHYHVGGSGDLSVVAEGLRIHEMDVTDAVRVLRLLAAVGVLPARFAEQAGPTVSQLFGQIAPDPTSLTPTPESKGIQL